MNQGSCPCKGSNPFTLAHQTCKLEIDIQCNVSSLSLSGHVHTTTSKVIDGCNLVYFIGLHFLYGQRVIISTLFRRPHQFSSTPIGLFSVLVGHAYGTNMQVILVKPWEYAQNVLNGKHRKYWTFWGHRATQCTLWSYILEVPKVINLYWSRPAFLSNIQVGILVITSINSECCKRVLNH